MSDFHERGNNMTIPKKDKLVHQRDDDNNLLPRKVELKTVTDSAKKFLGIDPEDPLEFKMVPATQGELMELQQNAEEQEQSGSEDEVTGAEIEFVTERIVEPDLTPEDMEYAQTQEIMGASLIALISESTGVPQDDVADRIEDSIEEGDVESFQNRGDSDEDEEE